MNKIFTGLLLTALALSCTLAAHAQVMYGTTSAGGPDNKGVIYAVNEGGILFSVYYNLLATDGTGPRGLIDTPDGRIFGFTTSGGSANQGVIFEYYLFTGYVKRFEFSGTSGANPQGKFVKGPNGNFYALTQNGGTNGFGVLFEYNTTTSASTVRYHFTATTGKYPTDASLMLASNNKFYGVASSGGTNNAGTLFEFDPTTNTFTKKIDFATANGSAPTGGLVQASNGKLYGVTTSGGTTGVGVLYEYVISTNTYTKRYDFSAANGSNPVGQLVQAPNGNLYGLTTNGGSNAAGVIYEFNPTTNVTTKKIDLHPINGSFPKCGMTLTSSGTLLGITEAGDTNNAGTVFEYDPVTNSFIKKTTLNNYSVATPAGPLLRGKSYQQISFGTIPTKTYGDLPFNLTASASLPVVYSSSDPAVATISGNTVTITGGGTATITAMQSGNAAYYPAQNVSRTLTVNKVSQSISFNAIPDIAVGDAAATLTATTSSGLPISYSSSNPAIASVSGNTITAVAPGSVTITAQQAGNNTYTAATPVAQPLTVLAQEFNVLWGTTTLGGASGTGTIFKVRSDGTHGATVYHFGTTVAGENPLGHMTETSAGKIYGLTSNGGLLNVGVLFEYNATTNTYTKKLDMPEARGYGVLVEAASGNLFGLTSFGGMAGQGSIFEYNPVANTYTTKYSFSWANGKYPFGALVRASNGKFYGTTTYGGTNDVGVLFEYDPVTNVCTKKIDFGSALGASPTQSAVLVEGASGKLYGTTDFEGAYGQGTLYEYDCASGSLTVKYNFSDPVGIFPNGNMVKASNGKIYGNTKNGGANNQGTLFEYDPATSTYTRKLDFYPLAPARDNMIQAANGKIYFSGVVGINGSIMEYDIASNTVLDKFYFTDQVVGKYPAGLMLTSSGKMLGLCYIGGASNAGTLFEYNPSTNVQTKKLDFLAGDAAGGYPVGDLVKAGNGKIYGAAKNGGATGVGVLFEFTPATGAYVKKVDLTTTLGTVPAGGMVEFTNTRLYGLAAAGGTTNEGSLYEYNPATNSIVKKADFASATKGKTPVGRLVLAANLKFYGVTEKGGTNNVGVLFEYNAATNVFTKKYDFSVTDGSVPKAGLVEAANGKLYGTTSEGGANNYGVIFEYDPATNVYTKKTDLTTTTGGAPQGALMQALNGKLYGTASYPENTVIEYDPVANTLTKTADIDYTIYGNLVQSSTGKLYGPEIIGGEFGDGVIAEYDITSQDVTETYSLTRLQGSFPKGSLLSELPDVYVTAPVNYAVGQTVAPVVTAKLVTGATTYTIELNTSPLFNGTSFVLSGARTQTFSGLAFSTRYYARVKTNISPIWGMVTNFVTGDALSLSYLVTPANNATNQLWTLNVTANTLTGATSYTVQLSPVSDFSSGIVQNTGATTTLLFSGLAFDTKYFTRVSSDLTPGNWGPVRNFTTGNPVTRSYITSPANGAVNIGVTTNLICNPVQDATLYTVEANTASDFTGTSIVHSSSTTTTAFVLSYGTLYYVRVKTNLAPDWGPSRSFTTSSAISNSYVTVPANNATNQLYNLNVTANTIVGASVYTIQLSPLMDFSAGIIEVSGSSNVLGFTGLNPFTTYYSRVTTDLSPGQWGAVRNFKTLDNAITSPANNATGVLWSVNLVSNTLSGATLYTIEANTASDFTGTSIVNSNSSPTVAFTLAYDQLYYVRVKTNLSPGWGTSRSFTTSNPVSMAFVQTPANLATNVATTVFVSALSLPGATSYTIELNTASDFTGTSIVRTNASRTINFSGLGTGTTYYSRVHTSLASGIWGPTKSFTTTGSARIRQEPGPDESIVSDDKKNFQIIVAENPFQDKIVFVLESRDQAEASVRLIDMSGRELFKGKVATNITVEIDQALQQGVFLLEARIPGKRQALRVIKMK